MGFCEYYRKFIVQTLSQKRFCVYHYPHIPLASTPNLGRVSKASSYRIDDRLLAAGLKLKAKKCHLFCKKVVYLGHVISEAGIATDPEKTKIVDSWPVPTNFKELRDSSNGFITCICVKYKFLRKIWMSQNRRWYQSIFEFFKCCLTFICPFKFSPFLCEFVL
jgi:hypothetical protein